MAAALRRRAEAPSAPSLALLQPLFPRPYSKLSAPPAPSPSLLCCTSGEGCSALPPRKPTDPGREVTQRPLQPSSPLLAISATSNILGMQLDIDLEPDRMMCKRTKNSLESMRQELKELQRSRETQRTLEKICKWLEFANVVLGALVLLMLLLITMGMYLA